MNLKEMSYRSTHKIMHRVLKRIKFPVPPILKGVGMVQRFPEVMRVCGVSHLLIVTDKNLLEAGLLSGFLKAMDAAGLAYSLYDGAEANPTVTNIEDGLAVYLSEGCDGIVGFGGGSAIDCAKVIAARVTNDKPIVKMKGMFKLSHRLPPLFGVPTTAGSGSEASIAAVVRDPAVKKNFVVCDTKLAPLAIVLDPELTVSLPADLTAATGMDALVRAIEAYMGWYDLPFVQEKALAATRTILNDLEDVYQDGSNMTLRQNMLMASCDAGMAFSRGYVGYAHAISGSICGQYGLPQSCVNAAVLPKILEFSLEASAEKLAEIARYCKISPFGESDEMAARKLIEYICQMREHMHLPDVIEDLKQEDIPTLADYIIKEVIPVCPVMKIMTYDECAEILKSLLPSDAS